ncbi:hypothetical protein GCM10029978_108060 [Actinoallomurus acanthiterrae]
MVGVDDSVADLESHVTSTPSAMDKGSTLQGPAEPTIRTYVQVSGVIRVLTKLEFGVTPGYEDWIGPHRSHSA